MYTVIYLCPKEMLDFQGETLTVTLDVIRLFLFTFNLKY